MTLTRWVGQGRRRVGRTDGGPAPVRAEPGRAGLVPAADKDLLLLQ